MAWDPQATPPPPPPPSPGALDRPFVRLLVAALLLAALGGAAFALRSSRGGATPSPTPAARVVSGATATPEAGLGPLDGRAPVLKQPAPDLALRTADGELVKLSDYRGKVVWINFWASWCIPCKKELPDIQKLSDEFSSRGLVVLTVNYQEGVPDAKDFFAQLGVTLPILMDSGSVYNAYRLRGLPDSFFVDRNGVLQAQQFGSFTPETMRQRLAAAGMP
ncbi:MAG TPA: TlpA disulfide reductase family protein [Dehalococcoidia bacterium]|nr:TlpA disulfide reductase family protein [Dehalococcoidia bacterium]